MRKELEFKKKIVLFGTEKEIRDTEKVISNSELSGNESSDRLILQELIDSHNLKTDILYNGNTIVPYKKTLREFKKHNKNGTLDGLSNYFYKFLHITCGDIAHYNKNGYIDYYDNDFTVVKNEIINTARAPYWKSDFIKVLEEIKNK